MSWKKNDQAGGHFGLRATAPKAWKKKIKLDNEDMTTTLLQNMSKIQASLTICEEPKEMAQIEVILDSEREHQNQEQQKAKQDGCKKNSSQQPLENKCSRANELTLKKIK